MTFAGWIEVLVIAALALVIVGPKDLPKVLYGIGRFIAKIKSMSQGFMTEFEQIHHFSEVEKMNRERHKDEQTPS